MWLIISSCCAAQMGPLQRNETLCKSLYRFCNFPSLGAHEEVAKFIARQLTSSTEIRHQQKGLNITRLIVELAQIPLIHHFLFHLVAAQHMGKTKLFAAWIYADLDKFHLLAHTKKLQNSLTVT